MDRTRTKCRVVSRRLHAAGLTLPEALIASMILAMAVVAITQAVATGQAQTYAALHEHRAISLAEAMMDEVLSLPYDDPDGASTPGTDSGEVDREDFDNSDDFNGFTEEPGELTDQAGEAYSDVFQVFTRSVTATYGTVRVPGFGVDQQGLSVTVTVTDAKGLSWTITRFVPKPYSLE